MAVVTKKEVEKNRSRTEGFYNRYLKKHAIKREKGVVYNRDEATSFNEREKARVAELNKRMNLVNEISKNNSNAIDVIDRVNTSIYLNYNIPQKFAEDIYDLMQNETYKSTLPEQWKSFYNEVEKTCKDNKITDPEQKKQTFCKKLNENIILNVPAPSTLKYQMQKKLVENSENVIIQENNFFAENDKDVAQKDLATKKAFQKLIHDEILERLDTDKTTLKQVYSKGNESAIILEAITSATVDSEGKPINLGNTDPKKFADNVINNIYESFKEETNATQKENLKQILLGFGCKLTDDRSDFVTENNTIKTNYEFKTEAHNEVEEAKKELNASMDKYGQKVKNYNSNSNVQLAREKDIKNFVYGCIYDYVMPVDNMLNVLTECNSNLVDPNIIENEFKTSDSDLIALNGSIKNGIMMQSDLVEPIGSCKDDLTAQRNFVVSIIKENVVEYYRTLGKSADELDNLTPEQLEEGTKALFGKGVSEIVNEAFNEYDKKSAEFNNYVQSRENGTLKQTDYEAEFKEELEKDIDDTLTKDEIIDSITSFDGTLDTLPTVEAVKSDVVLTRDQKIDLIAWINYVNSMDPAFVTGDEMPGETFNFVTVDESTLTAEQKAQLEEMRKEGNARIRSNKEILEKNEDKYVDLDNEKFLAEIKDETQKAAYLNQMIYMERLPYDTISKEFKKGGNEYRLKIKDEFVLRNEEGKPILDEANNLQVDAVKVRKAEKLLEERKKAMELVPEATTSVEIKEEEKKEETKKPVKISGASGIKFTAPVLKAAMDSIIASWNKLPSIEQILNSKSEVAKSSEEVVKTNDNEVKKPEGVNEVKPAQKVEGNVYDLKETNAIIDIAIDLEYGILFNNALELSRSGKLYLTEEENKEYLTTLQQCVMGKDDNERKNARAIYEEKYENLIIHSVNDNMSEKEKDAAIAYTRDEYNLVSGIAELAYENKINIYNEDGTLKSSKEIKDLIRDKEVGDKLNGNDLAAKLDNMIQDRGRDSVKDTSKDTGREGV